MSTSSTQNVEVTGRVVRTVFCLSQTAPDRDTEPSRSTYQVHGNGIFDVKWSPHDRFIATGSGDHSVRIINPSRSTSGPLYNLRGHTSTVKCVAWDPSHQDLLASAGRDGSICIWDLRERHKFEMNSREMEEETTLLPVLRMPYAHEPIVGKATKKGRTLLAPRSITSLVYSPSCSHEIISSGSYDGYVRSGQMENSCSIPILEFCANGTSVMRPRQVLPPSESQRRR